MSGRLFAAHRWRVAALMLLLLPTLISLSSANSPALAAIEAQVQMKDFRFTPNALTIRVGTTVVWTNLDSVSHNVAITSGPELWVSPEQHKGQAAHFKFTRPGKYNYYCEFHPGMEASLVVTMPSGSLPADSFILDTPPNQGIATQTFPETGKSVRGRFLEYWKGHGGLTQQGFPISEEIQEKSDTDGKSYTVQYFERAVFELHPENQPPNDVLLSLLGNFLYKQKYPSGAPGQAVNTSAGSQLFKETGKHVGGKFLDYWNTHGGLAQQGYPISEEFVEKNELDGKSYRVQYFERAVFELHPENAAPYDVLLSQLGTFRYKTRGMSK